MPHITSTSPLGTNRPDHPFGGSLTPGSNPALLIVDFVKAYLLHKSPLYANAESARVACTRLLVSARAAKLLIVHTNVHYERGGRDGGIFFRKVPALRCFEEGSDPTLAEFASELEPKADEIVLTKQYASAFFSTPLASMLTAARIDTVLIAGVSTSGCIRATAVDACQHGFIPVVVRDAVADRAAGPHEANLFDLQAKYAEVLSLQAVEQYMIRMIGAR